MHRLFAVALLLVVGCAITEESKQLNHQSRGAAQSIKKTATQPEVIQAADDIEKNSDVLAKTEIGEPKSPQPYSKEASADARKKAEENSKSGWLGILLTGVLSILGSGALFRSLTAIFPTLIGGPAGVVASTLIEGIAKARNAAQQNGGTLSEESLLGLLKQAQESAGVRELVTKWAHRTETKVFGKKL